jgi:hypothetical protein
MRENKIYWKVNTQQQTKEIIQCLNDKYLIIELVERKNNKIKKINTVNVSHLPKMDAIDSQIEFLENNKVSNMYQFYIIKSI